MKLYFNLIKDTLDSLPIFLKVVNSVKNTFIYKMFCFAGLLLSLINGFNNLNIIFIFIFLILILDVFYANFLKVKQIKESILLKLSDTSFCVLIKMFESDDDSLILNKNSTYINQLLDYKLIKECRLTSNLIYERFYLDENAKKWLNLHKIEIQRHLNIIKIKNRNLYETTSITLQEIKNKHELLTMKTIIIDEISDKNEQNIVKDKDNTDNDEQKLIEKTMEKYK